MPLQDMTSGSMTGNTTSCSILKVKRSCGHTRRLADMRSSSAKTEAARWLSFLPRQGHVAQSQRGSPDQDKDLTKHLDANPRLAQMMTLALHFKEGSKRNPRWKGGQIIADYYRDCGVLPNPQRTQLWSAQSRPLRVKLDGVTIRAQPRIRLLGVDFVDISGDMTATNDTATLGQLVVETSRLQSLPVALPSREAAFAAITAKKIWYCPWKDLAQGQRLTKARAAVIRDVRPGTGRHCQARFCDHGHVP